MVATKTQRYPELTWREMLAYVLLATLLVAGIGGTQLKLRMSE